MQMVIISHHVGDRVGFQTGGVDNSGGGKFEYFFFFIARKNPVVARLFFYPYNSGVINNMCLLALSAGKKIIYQIMNTGNAGFRRA
jgi:hypothetical protein